MIELRLPKDTMADNPVKQVNGESKPVTELTAALAIRADRTPQINLLLLCVIAIGQLFTIGLLWDRPSDSRRDDKRDEQHQVVPDGKGDGKDYGKSDGKADADKSIKPPIVRADGAAFVFVLELQSKTANQELLLRGLDDFETKFRCRCLTLDRDLKDAEPYERAAAQTGRQAPFVAVVRDRRIVQVLDWPASIAALEAQCQ